MATATARATNQTTKVVTDKCRLSYVYLFQPRPADDENEKAKYSVCLLIPKSDTQTVAKIQAAVKAAMQAGLNKWGGKVPPNLKMPLRDGDTERDTEEQPEYAGHWFVNANSIQQPGIVDQNVQPILDSTEVYSGCYGRASVNFYAYNTKGNKGIACGLNHIQKLADGDFLGGRSKPEDDFEPVATEAAAAVPDYLN